MNNLIQYYDYYQKNQNSTLPFAIEFDSGIEGPHLIFVGSIHGHEPGGTVALVEIHKLLVAGKIKLNKGKVIFVLGNPAAFLENKRFLDKNLNRVFLDDLEEHIEGRRAEEFRQYLSQTKVDGLFDLHSVSVGDFKFAIYFDIPETKKVAVAVSPVATHMIADSLTVPGTLMEEAIKYGATGLVFECGNNTDPKTVEIAKYHIISCMLYYELIDSQNVDLPDITPSAEICMYKIEDIIKPGLGFEFVDPNTTTGTFIKKGDIYLKYENTVAISREDYYIVMPDKNPNVKDNDAGFLCSRNIVLR